MALPGYRAQVKIMTNTAPINFTNQAMATTDTARQLYTISNPTFRYFSKSASVTWLVETSPNGTTWTAVAADQYNLLYGAGSVYFYQGRAVGTQVRISGAYVTTTLAAEVREYTFTLNSQLVDITSYQEPPSPWRTRLANLTDATGSLTGWYFSTNLFQDYLLNGNPCVLEFYANRTPGDLFSCYAYLDTVELAAAIENAVEIPVSFQSDGVVNALP